VTSGLHRFQDRVEIQLVAQIHELLAQRGDVYLGGDVHDHLHGKHRGSGVRGGIANSVPSALMRLSTMLPLQSSTTRVRS
jgi:hypothetical protein